MPPRIKKKGFTVTAEYIKATVHSVYGKVVISVNPGRTFGFKSRATWPEKNYDKAVLDGILDALKEMGISKLPVKLHLKEIGWRDNEHCWDGYYYAGKRAAQEIIQILQTPK